MKIIIANYRYFLAGGPERYMFKFMKAAEERGVTCIPFSVDYARNEATKYAKYFVTPRGGRGNIMFADIKLTPANIIKMLNSTIYNFEAQRKLRKLIRDEKPDAVYILHEINSLSPSIIRAAKKEGVRVVHRISDFFMFCPKLDFLCGNEICESCIHGNYKKALKCKCVKGSFFATLVRVLAMKLYAVLRVFDDVDVFITTCEFTRNKMIEGGIPAEKIKCVPTFIDANSITPCYENEGYFLYLGRVAEQKGVIYAVLAMVELRDLPVKLKITGELDDSHESQKIREIIKSEGLENSIEFVGFQQGEELEKTISKAIAIINPAIWYENMPNTIIEAYAYGKPVIASRIGSLEEIVQDKKTGLLFEAKNACELTEKMRILVLNKETVKNMGKQARKVSQTKYSGNEHMDRILEFLMK